MEQRMPLARYFFCVGGVLLALLLLLGAYLPKDQVTERPDANLPVIRIHSDRKWPERVVYDTSLPTITPTQTASGEASIPRPATVADVSVKTSEREALAQMQPSDARQLQPNSKKREPKQQRKARIAKRHVVPRFFLASRQTQFVWFRNSFW
jgi:hypothetical protein